MVFVLDVFGIHGVAAIVGATLLVFFVRPSWMAAAAEAAGGSWSAVQQGGVQALSVVITLVFAGGLTFVLALVVERTVGLRVTPGDEAIGLDLAEHGEHAYGFVEDGSPLAASSEDDPDQPAARPQLEPAELDV